MKNFIHYHNHSDYSLLDGATRIPDMIKKIKEFDMPAVALTDHGNMFGVVQLWREAKKENIKPIIGNELYVSVGDHKVKSREKGKRHYYHLVALAMNKTGYKNLCKLTSLGFTEGFYYKPRVSMELLKKYSEGIFASSACLAGSVSWQLMKKVHPSEEVALMEGVKHAEALQEIYGDNFRLELQDHEIQEQYDVNLRMIKVSELTGIPLMFTNDCHFLDKENMYAHKALTCIQGNQRIADKKSVYEVGHRIKSTEEMLQLVDRYPDDLKDTIRESMEETEKILPLFDFEFQTGKYYFPKIDIKEQTVQEKFREECIEGFKNRSKFFKQDKGNIYFQRLMYEMELIQRMGFESYFLIVSDLIRYAKKNDIPVGVGRGSAAGSLVSYCLDITELDPISHGLLFERFLNPARISMPDIDIDFSKRNRHKLIEYTIEKYGRENVAQIVTFGTLKARAALRDMARVHGMPIDDALKLSALVPHTPGDPYDLDRALEEVPEVSKALMDPDKKKIWDVAKQLENTKRNASMHAAGVVITPKAVNNYAPLFKQSNSDDIAAGYDMNDLEELGLVKMDYLGLKTLDLIKDTKDLAGVTENLDELDLEDPNVYSVFATGNTKGVFQFESGGMRHELIRLQPEQFKDIVAMNALYRPGPMDSGMMESFIKRKRGQEEIEFVHDDLKDILESTYGVIVYQEQVMNIVQRLAGFSLGEADVMRKAMGKKKKELMEKEIEKFIEGGKQKGYSKEKLEEIADILTKFSRYGFNLAHAASYSFIAYQTAWLKYYYPTEFMCALLNNETEDKKPEKVQEYIGDAKKMKIAILPPDVNFSGCFFEIEDKKKIRYGMAGIKNVGEEVAQNIVNEREKNGEFKSLADFVDRLPLNKRVIEGLIFAGATRSLGGHPAEHYANFEKLIKSKKKAGDRGGQVSLLKELGQYDMIIQEDIVEVPEWTNKELSHYEKEAIGLWLDQHPLNEFIDDIDEDLAWAKEKPRKRIHLTVVIAEMKERFSKNHNEKFLMLKLEDLSGQIDAIVWGTENTIRLKEDLEEGNVVKITGNSRMREDEMSISIYEVKVLSRDTLERELDES